MTENEVKYEEVYKVLNEILVRNARYMNFKITQEFKDKIIDIVYWACRKENVHDDIVNYMRNSSNCRRAARVIELLCCKLNLLDDDLEIYSKLKKVIEDSECISNVVKPYVLSMIDSAFESVYTEEKYNELMDERNSRQILTINENDFVRIMEEHHRYKWGNHMPFIIEKETRRVNGDLLYSIKPKYVYRDENSEFYVNDDLIKTIISESFDEYEVEHIELLTSYSKLNWTSISSMVRRDKRGNPADQDSMRMMRHPGMYENGDVVPVFNCIKVHVKDKKKENAHQLVR